MESQFRIEQCKHALQWQQSGHPHSDVLEKVGLGSLSKLDWRVSPYAVALVCEFINNFDIHKQTTIVKGQQIVFDAKLVSRALGLKNEGTLVGDSDLQDLFEDGAYNIVREGWKLKLLKGPYRRLLPCFYVMAEVVDMSSTASELTSSEFISLLGAALQGTEINWAIFVHSKVTKIIEQLLVPRKVNVVEAGPAAIISHAISCALKNTSMSETRVKSEEPDPGPEPMGHAVGNSSSCSVEKDQLSQEKLKNVVEAEISKGTDQKNELYKGTDEKDELYKQLEQRVKTAEQRASEAEERANKVELENVNLKSCLRTISKIIKK